MSRSVSGWNLDSLDELGKTQNVPKGRRIVSQADSRPGGEGLATRRRVISYTEPVAGTSPNVPSTRGRVASFPSPTPRGTYIMSARIDDPESGAIFAPQSRREAREPVHLVDYGNGVFSRPRDVTLPGTAIVRSPTPPPSTDIVQRAIADLQVLPARLGMSMPAIQDVGGTAAAILVTGALGAIVGLVGLAVLGASR